MLIFLLKSTLKNASRTNNTLQNASSTQCSTNNTQQNANSTQHTTNNAQQNAHTNSTHLHTLSSAHTTQLHTDATPCHTNNAQHVNSPTRIGIPTVIALVALFTGMTTMHADTLFYLCHDGTLQTTAAEQCRLNTICKSKTPLCKKPPESPALQTVSFSKTNNNRLWYQPTATTNIADKSNNPYEYCADHGGVKAAYLNKIASDSSTVFDLPSAQPAQSSKE